jgi:hypothetical protein
LKNYHPLITLCSAAAIALAAPLASSHHAFTASFDAKRPIEISGVVTRVEWQNPHIWFYIDVEAEDGATENWGLEMASPNLLIRNGWSRSSLQVGDEVIVAGFQAKNGSKIGNAQVVTLARTGEKLFTASRNGGRQ